MVQRSNRRGDTLAEPGTAIAAALSMRSGIPRRYAHFVFGVIQSGITCLVAAGIASLPMVREGDFLRHWLAAWLIAWATMLPVVLLAAPFIPALVERVVED